MSRLLNTYKNLKKQNTDVIYLFKSGAFYLALEEDAKMFSDQFGLKLINLNDEAVKCGFPCSSFSKYYLMLNSMNKDFKVIDKDTISDAEVYLENIEVIKLLNKIKEIDVDKLSISEAFKFIEDVNKEAGQLLGGIDE